MYQRGASLYTKDAGPDPAGPERDVELPSPALPALWPLLPLTLTPPEADLPEAGLETEG